ETALRDMNCELGWVDVVLSDARMDTGIKGALLPHSLLSTLCLTTMSVHQNQQYPSTISQSPHFLVQFKTRPSRQELNSAPSVPACTRARSSSSSYLHFISPTSRYRCCK